MNQPAHETIDPQYFASTRTVTDPVNMGRAQAIWDHLGGYPFLKATGAHQGYAIPRGLRFLLPKDDPRIKGGIDIVHITLRRPAQFRGAGYDMKFIRIDRPHAHACRFRAVIVAELYDVPAENLAEEFTRITGLEIPVEEEA